MQFPTPLETRTFGASFFLLHLLQSFCHLLNISLNTLFFAVVLHDYIMKLPATSSYTLYGPNFMCSYLLVLLLLLIFTLVAASISHFLPTAIKFSCCSSNKNVSFVIFSLSLALCHSFSCWALLASLLLSLFRLCLSLSLHSKFVDMTINLSLILHAIQIQKQFRLSVFIFIRVRNCAFLVANVTKNSVLATRIS